MKNNKTVILLTTNEEMRSSFVNDKELNENCNFKFTSKSIKFNDVSAIVYDIPTKHEDIDIKWLKNLDIPVVVLSFEKDFPLPENSTRKILTYPVTKEQVIKALEDIGVSIKEKKEFQI